MTSPAGRTGTRSVHRGAAVVTVLLIVVAWVVNARMFPLSPTHEDVTPEVFWSITTGVDVSGKDSEWLDDWLGCDRESCYAIAQGMHGLLIRRVSRQDLQGKLRGLLEATRTAVAAADPNVRHDVPEALACFDDSDAGSEVGRFTKCFHHARAKRVASKSQEWPLWMGGRLATAWGQVQLIPRARQQAAFEAIWLTVVILLVASPVVLRRSAASWGRHFGAAPFAFMLPLYFGYQPWLGSSIGAHGGGLYTFLAWRLPRWSFGFDDWLRDLAPPVMEFLSLVPYRARAPSLEGSLLGPSVTAALSVSVGVVTFLIVRRMEARRASPEHVQWPDLIR